MNLREYSALLDDEQLCHEARLVYLVFRRYMDFATGVTGDRRVVDYNEIRQSLEYLPTRGSREKAQRYSKDQIKRYIQLLVDRGFLERLHGVGLRQKMRFRLLLASADSIRPNEERHESATRGAPLDKPASTGLSDTNPARCAPLDVRHISDISDTTLSLHSAREKFQMFADWEPEKPAYVDQAVRQQGIDVDRIPINERLWVLSEFVTYWMDRVDTQLTQRGWESKLVGSVVHHVKTGRLSA